jgi:hypothetical protein
MKRLSLFILKYIGGFIAILFVIGIYRSVLIVGYENFVNKVERNTVKRLSKSGDFTCVGSGGSIPGVIRKLHLAFQHEPVASVSEARRLFVYLTEEYYKDINASKEIRPYLTTYPFPRERVDIMLIFYEKATANLTSVDESDMKSAVEKTRSENKPLLISSVSAFMGKIEYRNRDGCCFTTVYEEPYEEALRIVEEEKKMIDGALL